MSKIDLLKKIFKNSQNFQKKFLKNFSKCDFLNLSRGNEDKIPGSKIAKIWGFKYCVFTPNFVGENDSKNWESKISNTRGTREKICTSFYLCHSPFISWAKSKVEKLQFFTFMLTPQTVNFSINQLRNSGIPI